MIRTSLLRQSLYVVTTVSLLWIVSTSCWCPRSSAAQSPDVAPLVIDDHEVELSALMGEMQRHAAKLGYSIEGTNQKLARFYLGELLEVYGEVKEVELYDGVPVNEAATIIVDPLVPPLQEAIEKAAWSSAWSHYEALIDGCNRCHALNEHEYIQILPAQGEPPFNQVFNIAQPVDD